MLKRSRIREEELSQVLSNEELDDEAKTAEIQKIIGSKFIPQKKYNDLKEETSKAYGLLQQEYNDYKQSKMTDEEKKQEYVSKLENNYKSVKLELNKKRQKTFL